VSETLIDLHEIFRSHLESSEREIRDQRRVSGEERESKRKKSLLDPKEFESTSS
jgi:hypothetical protein